MRFNPRLRRSLSRRLLLRLICFHKSADQQRSGLVGHHNIHVDAPGCHRQIVIVVRDQQARAARPSLHEYFEHLLIFRFINDQQHAPWMEHLVQQLFGPGLAVQRNVFTGDIVDHFLYPAQNFERRKIATQRNPGDPIRKSRPHARVFANRACQGGFAKPTPAGQ